MSVREIKESDIPLIIDYWYDADDEFLVRLGVDVNKIPSRTSWHNMLLQQISQSYSKKKSYCIIWEVDSNPAGHSNVNKIIFGKEAYMHLHLWHADSRQKGNGTEFVKKTLPFFFNNLELKNLYCEPYALNPPPNKTLQKLGFDFVNEHVTIPGFLNFEQKVNLWQLTLEKFKKVV